MSILFTQYSHNDVKTSLYIIDNDPVKDGGYLAYFIPKFTDQLPGTFTDQQAWEGIADGIDVKGFFVFLKATPTDFTVFLTVLESLLGALMPAHTSFAWIENTELSKGQVLSIHLDNLGPVISGNTAINLLGYNLLLANNAPIVKNEDGFQIAYPPVPDAIPPEWDQDIMLPLSGKFRGCIQTKISIADFSETPNEGWKTGFTYFVNTSGSIPDPIWKSLFFPLVNGGDSRVQTMFDATINPSDSSRSELAFTNFSFVIETPGDGIPYIQPVLQGTCLKTYFQNVYGNKAITLSPVTNSSTPAKLIFASYYDPVTEETVGYLTPSGDFELGVDGTPDTSEMFLCGFAGTEYILFTPKIGLQHGTILNFSGTPSSATPAYAPIFPIITKEGSEVSSASPLLTDTCQDHTYVASWACVKQNHVSTAPTYYAQPLDASLYHHLSSQSEGSKLLPLYPAQAAEFGESDATYFPIVPYGGFNDASFTSSQLEAFETEILMTVRRDAITKLSQSKRQDVRLTDDPPVFNTTTPQGLLASVNGAVWQAVLLAKATRSNDKTELLMFSQPGMNTLQDALQTNQLFLVATLADPIGTFHNKISISDWPFTIAVGDGNSQDFRNVLIIKFCKKSVYERAKSPLSWTQADTFNTDATAASNWIVNYIDAAREQVKTNPDDSALSNFVGCVTNSNWNGILALKVDIGLQNFPEELLGLLAGIDLSRFNAHHIGINANAVRENPGIHQTFDTESTPLEVSDSSLFGLINYVDSGYQTELEQQAYAGSPEPREVPDIPPYYHKIEPSYDFKVLTLQVLFENSAIHSFHSKIRYITDSWFNELAYVTTGVMNRPNPLGTIEMDGHYEKHGNQNIYTFVTSPNEIYNFRMNSRVLKAFHVTSAEFNTLNHQPVPNSHLLAVESQFTFWGYIDFHRLTYGEEDASVYDLFSFGSSEESIVKKEGLYFSNMGVKMRFNLDAAASVVSDRRFVFDPSSIGFDASVSTVRKESLFRMFPLQVKGLIYVPKPQKTTPEDLGYLSVVTTDGFTPGQLSSGETWFALVFAIQMGSAGALATDAGFCADLMVAWMPGKYALNTSVGIKLPLAGGGKKVLSLENVLKLGMDSIQLLANTTDGKTNYTMWLSNIGLKFLGVSIPPKGSTDVALFGSPSGKNLGWYAGYKNAGS